MMASTAMSYTTLNTTMCEDTNTINFTVMISTATTSIMMTSALTIFCVELGQDDSNCKAHLFVVELMVELMVKIMVEVIVEIVVEFVMEVVATVVMEINQTIWLFWLTLLYTCFEFLSMF